jgi:acyl carrier protein
MENFISRINKLIADTISEEESKINPKMNLVEDLKLDSLEIYDLITALEDEFDVIIPNESANKIVTIEDIYTNMLSVFQAHSKVSA